MKLIGDSKMVPWEWLRANLKLILFGINAVVLVVLVVMLISQGLFEFETRGLLKQATTIDQESKKAASLKGEEQSSPEGQQPYADRSGGGFFGRGREKGLRPGENETSGSQTETSSSMGTTSATAATSETALASKQTTTTTEATAATIGIALPTSATTKTTLTGERVSSATLASSATIATATPTTAERITSVTSQTPVSSSASATLVSLLTSSILSSTETMALQKATVRFFGAAKMLRPKMPTGDHLDPYRQERGPRMGGPMGGPEDEKKREMFAKLEKRGLFGEPRPAAMQPQVEAILGDAALVSGQWLTVGGKMGEWKVVEIGTDKIAMEDAAGKQQDFRVMLATGGEGPGGPPRMVAKGEMSGPPGSGPDTAGTPGMALSVTVSPGMGGPPKIPDEIFRRLSGPGGRYEGMSREQMMERLRNMRPEEQRDSKGKGRKDDGRRRD